MKRTIISTVCLIVTLLLAVSCNKTDSTDRETTAFESGRGVINAVAVVVGSDTKTHNAVCYEVLWDESDKIFVTDGKNTDNFTISAGAGSANGTFTQDIDNILNPSKKKISGKVEIFSPSSLKDGDCYFWPASQTADPPVPMYTKDIISGTGKEKVYFSGLGAVLQIVLTTSEKNIGLTKIKLYDSDKPMSGEFTVEDGKAVITSTDKSGITVNLDNVTIGNAAKFFNISVPAGKYENLHLEFTFSDGRTRKMVSTTMPEIMLNSVAQMAIYLDISRMPKSISLNYNKLDLIPGDNYQLLKATVLPENAENKNVIWSSSDESIATVDQSGKVTALALGDCTITATAADSWLTASCALTVTEVPSGALPGKFSVSDTKKVYFSKGNMYHGTWIYNRWHKEGFYLEDHQWQRQPSRDSLWRKDHKIHFYWSKIDVIACWQHYYRDESHATVDDFFFTNKTADTPNPDFSVIINDVERKGVWRTLSTEEWEYLLRKRKMTYDKPRCTNWFLAIKLKDGEIYKGILVYPDDYNGPEIVRENREEWGKTLTWKDIEDAGILFLRSCGIREEDRVTKTELATGEIGCYWTSDCSKTDRTQACSMYFQDMTNPFIPDSGIYTEDTSYRGTARNVRLVRDVLE